MKLHRIAVCVTLLLVGCGGATTSTTTPGTTPLAANATTEAVGSVAPAATEAQATAAQTMTIETTGTEDMTVVPTMMAMETVTADDATAAETAAAETTASTARVGAVGAGEPLPYPITLPEGFTITTYAQGLGSPRFMAYGPDGTLYVTDIAGGRVLALPDTNGDGVADSTSVAIDNLVQPHGIAFHENALYVGETNQIVRFAAGDGAVGRERSDRAGSANRRPSHPHDRLWTRYQDVRVDWIVVQCVRRKYAVACGSLAVRCRWLERQTVHGGTA